METYSLPCTNVMSHDLLCDKAHFLLQWNKRNMQIAYNTIAKSLSKCPFIYFCFELTSPKPLTSQSHQSLANDFS